MALSLKTRGLEEIESLKARVARQHMFKRIGATDSYWLTEHLKEIEAYIITMREEGPDLDH